jgi:hypothetical protein
MRRYLFVSLASLALLATAPATSLARDHADRDHDRGHRIERHRHAARHHDRRRDRTERLTPVGGVSSPASAGTVQSFSNHVLTIKANDGSTVSGRVVAGTQVTCDMRNDQFQREDGGPGPSGGGDRNRGDNDGNRADNDGNRADNDGNRADNDGNRADNDGDRADNDGERGDPGDRDHAGDCLMALQTPGTVVHDATLRVTNAGAVWTRIDLDS